MSSAPVSGYYTTHRPDMFRFVPDRPRKVLEIGCAAGGFSGQLADRAVELWGVEPNAAAAAIAATRLTKVLVGLYDDVADQLPDGAFDLIICNDVIEHMPDHDRFLQQIKRKMAPDAVLIGSLPNVRHITALLKLLVMKDWPYKDEGILDRTHLRFFTRRSIERTLIENGYVLEGIKGGSSVLTHGFVHARPLPNFIGRVVTLATILLTAGYYWDVQYPQYGFRVRLAQP